MKPPQKDPIGVAVAQILRTEAHRQNMTQTQLADLTGLPQATINGRLRGRNMNLTDARNISKALGLEYNTVVDDAITAAESSLPDTKENYGLVAHSGEDHEDEETENNRP